MTFSCSSSYSPLNPAPGYRPRLVRQQDVARSDAEEALCRVANSTGLKYSMAATAGIFLIASAFFIMCARTLKQDFVAPLGPDYVQSCPDQ